MIPPLTTLLHFQDQLVMTSGCEAAIDILLRCIVDSAEGVAVIVPAYHGFIETIEKRNLFCVVPIHIPFDQKLLSNNELSELIEGVIKSSRLRVKALYFRNG
jgi:DNA-binding transcriptional MocR family regulator